jgi:hypothetical protein
VLASPNWSRHLVRDVASMMGPPKAWVAQLRGCPFCWYKVATANDGAISLSLEVELADTEMAVFVAPIE